MNIKKITLTLIASLIITDFAYGIDRDGKWYGYWGWNRSSYANSDITFTGNDHSFTLENVKAHDRPNPFSDLFSHYLNPVKFTIPHYNFIVGYYINQNVAISLSFDHMKYVVDSDQKVDIKGKLPNGDSGKKIVEDFLIYEHTNGYNILSLNVEYVDSLYEDGNFDMSYFVGLGGGVVIPKSDVRLGEKKRRDELHLAGVDISTKAGIELTFYESYLFRTTLKTGYSDMFDVLTTYDGGIAKQKISYLQFIWALGYRF